MKSIDFFVRMTKYLRSIGYYGDSPFMMCNYGSSEYSQAFSRIGSLYRNVYIVNEALYFNEIKVDDQNIVESVDVNYNNEAIKLPKHGGLIATVHTLDLLKELVPDFEYEIEHATHCLRMTIISKKPLINAK